MSEVCHKESNRVEKYRVFNMSLMKKNKAIKVMGFDNEKRTIEHRQPNSGQQSHLEDTV